MTINFSSIQKHRQLYEDIKMVLIDALLGVIPTNLRAFGIGFESTPVFVSIFDTPPTGDEREDISCAITEVISDINQPVDEKYLTIAYPESISPYCPNWGWVYLRREESFQIFFEKTELQLILKLCFEVLHCFRVGNNEEKILKYFDFGLGTENKVLDHINEHYFPRYLIEELLFIRNATILVMIELNKSNSYVEHLGFELDDCLALLSRIDQEFLKYRR